MTGDLKKIARPEEHGDERKINQKSALINGDNSTDLQSTVESFTLEVPGDFDLGVATIVVKLRTQRSLDPPKGTYLPLVSVSQKLFLVV